MKLEDGRVEYDAGNRRLVYFGREADAGYWDERWGELDVATSVASAYPFVTGWTKRYLRPPARVLDAGCGTARLVSDLHRVGFEAWGIDFAEKTVEAVNRYAPHLRVQVGDVRALPFPDAYFDGIWSGGVIEHFSEGYDSIMREMWRALKPGGYAFVNVPSMSPIRRLKARLGMYREFGGNFEDFYQFALPSRGIIERFTREGWRFERVVSRGGFKGLTDESGPLRPALQRLYDLAGRWRYVRGGLNWLLAPVAYHTRLYIFRRPE